MDSLISQLPWPLMERMTECTLPIHRIGAFKSSTQMGSLSRPGLCNSGDRYRMRGTCSIWSLIQGQVAYTQPAPKRTRCLFSTSMDQEPADYGPSQLISSRARQPWQLQTESFTCFALLLIASSRSICKHNWRIGRIILWV